MNKEVKSRVKSIIEVLVFLIVMTAFWFGPREELTAGITANISDYYMNKTISVDTKEEISFSKNTEFKVINKTNQEQNYEIIIANDVRKSRRNNCRVLENNYVKYNLNSFEEKNLSVEGIIYTGVLKPNETKEFSIKLSLDENQKDCYYPVIKASTFYKI